jgi:glycine oxidase
VLDLPVRPVKGQILRVRATSAEVFPTRTVRGLGVYVFPRPGGEIAIGATSEERGYDTTVTAGGVHQLLHDAWELMPGLAEAEFVEAIAGLRPATPDNAPIIGSVPGGPVLALGHYRHGVLLAPVTADAVVAALFGEAPAPSAAVLAPFAPDRFVEVGA